MTSIDHVQRVQADAAVTFELAAEGLDHSVPACPGWDVSRLVGHLGRVYSSVAAHVRQLATGPLPSHEVARAPDGPAVVEFAAEQLDAVVAVLDAADLDAEMWTWTAQNTVGFYPRRIANETAIHRVDVEQALGRPVSAIDSDAGADGVDELLSVLLPPTSGRSGTALPAGSLHVHRTDGPGEWTVEVVDGVIECERTHGKGDAAVRGPGDQLYLALWGRRSLEGLEVFGDQAIAEAWTTAAP